jgi:PAS domain S-box-containing protein
VDLRKKTLAIICLTLLSLLLVLLVLSEIIVLGGFSDTELRSAEKDTNRVMVALVDDINTLDAMASDWASRDDTRAVISNASSSSQWSRFSDDTFERLQFNYIILLNSSMEPVAGKGYDLGAHRKMAIPEELNAILSSETIRLLQGNSTTGMMGIIQHRQGPLMLVIRPIYADSLQSRIIGYIFMGRYLDTNEVARLSSMVQLPLVVYDYHAPQLPPDFKAAAGQLVPLQGSFIQRQATEYMTVDAPKTYLVLDSTTLGTYSLIRDVYGEPALIVRISITRDIYEQGKSTTLYFVELLIAAGLIFGLVTLLLLEKTILSRISLLGSRVSFIGKNRDFSARIAISGDDELTALATDVNGMIEELETSQNQIHQRLVQREEHYRLFFNSITDPVIICRFDERDHLGTIIEANDAAIDVLGYSREELFAMSPGTFIINGEQNTSFYGRLWTKGHVTFESGYLTRSGRTIPVEINARVFDYFGRKGVLAIARDITERYDIERLKMEAFQQIEMNMQQFALLNDHIRNPLQGIIGIADLMQNESSEKIIRLAHVVNDLIHKLDRGYIESEKIYEFLRKYYGIGKK